MNVGSQAVGRKVVTVMSKPGCHLCEKVIGALHALASSRGFELRIVDIENDPRLHEMYWLEIPVVQVDGRDVFGARDMDARGEYLKRLEVLVG